MSLMVPFHRSTLRQCNYDGLRPSATAGTRLTAATTAHTVGTKADLITTTNFDSYGIQFGFQGAAASNTRTDQLLNVYVGASGSETVLIANITTGWSGFSTTNGMKTLFLPLYIPAGSRISADLQAIITSDTLDVMCEITGGGTPPSWVGQRVETLGAVTISSAGTLVSAGSTLDGDFHDIGTSVFEYNYIVPFMGGNVSNTTQANSMFYADIGVGGVALSGLTEFTWLGSTAEWLAPIGNMGRSCIIPAGTTLQIREQSSGGSENHDWIILGVY